MTDCDRGSEAVAYVQGELGPAEQEALLAHLESCGACRSLVADARAILGELGATVGEEWTETVAMPPEFVEPARRRSLSVRAWGAIGAAAAGLALVTMLVLDDEVAPPDIVAPGPAALAGQAPPSPVSWVESNLASNGTWYAFSQNQLRGRELGLHAFALLALVRGSEADAPAGRMLSVRDAAHWLMERQADDGSFGLPLSEGHFDHPVSTLALVEAAQATGDADIREAAGRALQHVVDQRDVLWRRVGQVGPAAWTMAALVRADQLGFDGLESVLAHGRAVLGPAAAATLGGDLLERESFWELALGGQVRPAEEPVADLFSASLAVLAPGRGFPRRE